MPKLDTGLRILGVSYSVGNIVTGQYLFSMVELLLHEQSLMMLLI